MRKGLLSLLATMLCVVAASGQDSCRRSFNDGWHFTLTPTPGLDDIQYSFDGDVTLPHDWAIYGDFNRRAASGTGGGALPGGFGVYTRTFDLDRKDRNKNVRLDFDGVYMDAEVIVNGHSFGIRPYGYISFGYDITPYVTFDAPNTVTVKVDNTGQPNSRWYSGCGIYRNVWLTVSPRVHVRHDGTYVRTEMKDGTALVEMTVEVENCTDRNRRAVIRNVIRDAAGNTVSEITTDGITVRAGDCMSAMSFAAVSEPHLWSLEDPYLYTLETSVENGRETDVYYTSFGIRTIGFSQSGFELNGQKVTINGVCNHHDMGCLGSAVSVRALERQLQILKEMGCNGIRCSHNPPAPELLDLCDRMGFVVMDEAFDMWRRGKTSHDYSRYFDEWYQRDLEDFVRRDRNHPSVVMWSIGNEVLEQWSDAKADTLTLEEANLVLNFGQSQEMLAKESDSHMSVNSLLTARLAGIVHELDSTRPVTAGCNEPNPYNHLFASGALDIIGYNYHNQNIAAVPRLFPGKPFVITESNSALMTRGYYRMPSDSILLWPARWDLPFYDASYSCSSYDNCHAPWGSTHEETMILLRRNPWIIGQFVWTGFDYLGEPTPYGWPARSSYFGIIDLAGFPKDIYYLYQSEWTSTPVLHLFPHWNESPGDSIRDMWCYYNDADEVELFVNGRSQGVRSKTADQLHVMWRVEYEPGEVTAVARRNGAEVRRETIRTAGEPARILLSPDRSEIASDGRDLSFVTVQIVDKDGYPCPLADNDVSFALTSENGGSEPALFIAGVDNGSPVSLERFKADHRRAFNGRCLVVLQNSGVAGKVTLTAGAEGLESASVEIVCGQDKEQ